MQNYRITYCREAHRVHEWPDGRQKVEHPDCPQCQDIAGLPKDVNKNCQMSDKERELLAVPFGPRAKNFKRAKDVDDRVEAFRAKYPMLRENYKSKSFRQIIREQTGK